MTIDLNRLKKMEKKDLIDVAKQVNAPFHPNNSQETIIENIINKVMEQSLAKPEPERPQVKEVVFLTEEELEKAFAPIKERRPAFSAVYDHEAKCCTMRYFDGRYKHAETMSLSCPLPKFIRKANEIARGPLILRGTQGDWDRLGGNNPQNAYTETVL